MRWLAFFTILLACSGPPKYHRDPDSVYYDTEPIVVEGWLTENLDDIVKIKELPFPNAHTTPQLDPQTAYVYNASGLQVYTSSKASAVIGHVAYKEKIRLVDKTLINNAPTDKVKVDGLFGRYVPIVYGGKTGYVFSGYLLNFPVPSDTFENEHGIPVMKYFIQNFQLEIPVLDTLVYAKEDTLQPYLAFTTASFERGVKLGFGHYHRSRNLYLSIKGMSAQEMFLLSRYFLIGFRKSLQKFPETEGESQDDNFAIEVKMEGGRVISINILEQSLCPFINSISDGLIEYGDGC